MKIIIRQYKSDDAAAACEIWNQVVEDGEAFPQEELLTQESGDTFFKEQTYTGIAENEETGEVVGSNIHALHLYERIGFKKVGVIPKGFRMKDGHYEDIIVHYYEL